MASGASGQGREVRVTGGSLGGRDWRRVTVVSVPLTQAATDGHIEAQYALALMFKEGEGVPKDWEQSMKWFNSAAVLGHAGT